MKTSAGILLYKQDPDLKVLIVHPGGPFWAKKDLGSWSMPKGLVEGDEDIIDAAIRETKEELGIDIELNKENLIDLGNTKLKSGKLIYMWGHETNLGNIETHSNTIFIDWPPKSGKKFEIPEIDKAEWYDLETAKRKLISAQIDFLTRLSEALS